jgi:hypothetical protein
MESRIFLDMTSCSPLKVNRRFGGTFRHIPPRGRLICNGLHGVLSQNIELFLSRLRLFGVFLSLSMQMPGYFHRLDVNTSFRILPNSVFTIILPIDSVEYLCYWQRLVFLWFYFTTLSVAGLYSVELEGDR